MSASGCFWFWVLGGGQWGFEVSRPVASCSATDVTHPDFGTSAKGNPSPALVRGGIRSPAPSNCTKGACLLSLSAIIAGQKFIPTWKIGTPR